MKSTCSSSALEHPATTAVMGSIVGEDARERKAACVAAVKGQVLTMSGPGIVVVRGLKLFVG